MEHFEKWLRTTDLETLSIFLLDVYFLKTFHMLNETLLDQDDLKTQANIIHFQKRWINEITRKSHSSHFPICSDQ